MALELIVNLLLLGFSIFCYFYVGATMPASIVRLVKSKLFFGMALVVIMALMYEPVGFIATCLLFLIAYGLLLGQRNMVLLLVTSVLITVLLYIGFAVFLGVMLPRGQVPFLRNFALFVESLIPAV